MPTNTFYQDFLEFVGIAI